MAAARAFEHVDWAAREPELCDLLAEGLSLREIAVRMQLSYRVVEHRFYKIRRGMGQQGQ